MMGQEGPARHVDRLPDSGKELLVLRFGYSLMPGTGPQPPPAASYPGLPEEQMLTDSVSTIAGAHDARSAAARLGSRCLMEATGPGSRPGGDAMTASAGHRVEEQRQERRGRISLRAPADARRRVSTIAAALGSGRRGRCGGPAGQGNIMPEPAVTISGAHKASLGFSAAPGCSGGSLRLAAPSPEAARVLSVSARAAGAWRSQDLWQVQRLRVRAS